MAHFVSEFGAGQTKISKRHSNGRIIVEKGNAMIMSDSVHPDGLSGVESDFAMYTNSPEMVDNIHTLCTLLWERSEYIDLPNLQIK